MEQFILELAQKYPTIMAIFMAMGMFRALFKPAMTLIEAYVKESPGLEDDSKLAKIKEKKWYRYLVYLLDYTASIKLPKKKKDA